MFRFCTVTVALFESLGASAKYRLSSAVLPHSRHEYPYFPQLVSSALLENSHVVLAVKIYSCVHANP